MDTGNTKKIEALYLQMYEGLLAYAWSCFENDALAEEAVQETFATACQKQAQLLGSSNPPGWLVNTLRFVIQNTLRTQKKAGEVLTHFFPEQLQTVMAVQNAPAPELLYADIADKEEFLLIKEMAIDGCSYLEMAQKRGISVQTCRKRLQRAKKFLQKKIEF